MFMIEVVLQVYGNAIYIDKSVLETYIAHVSALFVKIFKRSS